MREPGYSSLLEGGQRLREPWTERGSLCMEVEGRAAWGREQAESGLGVQTVQEAGSKGRKNL